MKSNQFQNKYIYFQNLTDRFRYVYSKLWLSILKVDRKGMRYYTEQLGIKSNLYGLFVCMVSGRPWESVSAGVTKRVSDEREVCVECR